MSGGGWSPEEIYQNSSDAGNAMAGQGSAWADSLNPNQTGGEFNTQPEGWGPYTPPPVVDPMTLINQKYLKQGSDNSLAPMQAYQQYMQNRR